MDLDLLTILASAANEEFVPPTDWRAIIALPTAILLFFGSIFLLLRSNLGTRRAYLVEASAFFGFMVILSTFWTFGAPGTPQATGPTNLPGTQPNAYQPTWTAFAGDSLIADEPAYSIVKEFPEGFGPVPEDFAQEAETGAADIQTFFASEEGGGNLGDLDEIVEVQYAEATNGRPIIAVTYQPVGETGEPEGDPVTFFGFFDEGNIIFPGLVMMALSLLGFLLHLFLLDRDEQRERKETEEVTSEGEKVPVSA